MSMISPSDSAEARCDGDAEAAAIVAAGLKAELAMQAACELPPKERPSWCPGAICSNPGCTNQVHNIAQHRTVSICRNCPYTSPRDPDCWCGLCLECTPRPIGTGPAATASSE